MTKRVTKDFETRSMCDLKKAGAYKYSLHPTTRPTCLAFKILGEPTVYFLDFKMINTPWKKLPQKFRDLWTRLILEGYLFTAHNSFFERCIYDNILVLRYGWPAIPPRQRRCTAAKCAAAALPRNLADAGAALKLAIQKYGPGYQAMMATCKPARKWNDWQKMRAAIEERKLCHKKLTPKQIKWLEASPPEPPIFLEPEAGPEVFDVLYKYCKIDVRTEELVDIALPDLIPSEQEIWFQNQMLNWRGLRIDIPTVNKIVDIMAIESEHKLEELDALTMGLVTKPGSRKSVLDFLALEGIELPNLRKNTVEEKLEGFELSDDMRRLLEIRQALTMTSTKKYQSFLNRAYDDDRVRDILLYHGASTGRDTGTGIQPHNFPRGLIKVNKDRPYAAVENVIECDAETLKMLYGESLGILFSAILRNMIIPSEEHELYVADFSKVEVAVLWWLADNEPGLKVLRNDLDPYKYQAAANTGKPYIAISDEGDERQLGKAQVLGCFADDTKVLTNSGWKRIIDVKLHDRLWDGIEWINHQGLLDQGVKNVISLFGVKLTSDHLLWSRLGWIPAEAVQRDEQKFRKLVLDLVVLPLSAIGSEHVAALWQLKFNATVELILTRFLTTTFLKEKVSSAMRALKNRITIGRNDTILTKLKCRTKVIEPAFSTAFRRPSLAAIIQMIVDMFTTAHEGFSFVTLGGPSAEHFSPTYRQWRGGKIQTLTWIESIIRKAMSPAISGSSHVQKICAIVERWRAFKRKYRNSKRVYDIADAGPRNRFTILTSEGPILVHNCGFGMGAPKFQKTAWDLYRVELTLAQSREAVKSYREANERVPALWKAYEAAAIQVVKRGGVIETGHCKFIYDPKKRYGGLRFLWVELPSGRRLAYADPQIAWRVRQYEVIEKDSKTGEEILVAKTSNPMETLEFWGVNSKTKKWSIERTWGGTLAENVTQAVARDLMMPGMVRLEKRGYRGLLMVHDEGITEKKIDTGSLEEFTKILCEVPPWGSGLPISAKGWTGPRYRKG